VENARFAFVWRLAARRRGRQRSSWEHTEQQRGHARRWGQSPASVMRPRGAAAQASLDASLLFANPPCRRVVVRAQAHMDGINTPSHGLATTSLRLKHTKLAVATHLDTLQHTKSRLGSKLAVSNFDTPCRRLVARAPRTWSASRHGFATTSTRATYMETCVQRRAHTACAIGRADPATVQTSGCLSRAARTTT